MMLPRRLTRLALLATFAAGLTGCGVVALPFRATSAVVKIVPVAGDVVAAPLDVTADVVD
ncbi:DUF6726 family protein [Pararoseomonas sp. SCSIO 73927]|uniref:DUF6726 family protein n=1 Tax=Pararoseomonas sp. SCSIO 73927 TaxID=3114537 RepID=UPI0030D128AD